MVLVALIYVKRDCPICQSLLRYTIIKGATSRKCVPLIFRDVDMVSLNEKRIVWTYEFDPNLGLVFRIYVPYLVIADVDEKRFIKQIFYRAPLIPKYPVGFSEAEVREVIYTTHSWCRYGKAMSKDAEPPGDIEPDEKPRRRRRSPRTDDTE
jgi:glutaredoxin